ncbi:MAG TPA: amino acid deaminase [Actinomycetota bacterium]|nr:amino acid deaminase [Actinomycetota bacterium]
MTILDLSLAERVEIHAGTKGFPVLAESVLVRDAGARGWSVPRDLRPPVMLLHEAAIEHNLALMAAFCREREVDLAPHGKTTMAPQLWDRQLRAGAWGISAATVAQAAVMRAVGVPRILVANEIVDAPSIAWVVEQLADPGFELLCYVDSLRGVSILQERLVALDASRRLRVLVELGHEGGRTGCRSVDEALDVADAVRAADRLELAGVSGYEGTIGDGRTVGSMAVVSGFLDRLRELGLALIERGAVEGEMVVSAGGSIFFDVVADRLREPWPAAADVRVVLRSGCYITHDDGMYERDSPFAGRDDPAQRFRSAIDVWSTVLSQPEPGLALLGFGRRDVSIDAGLPVPKSARTPADDVIRVGGAMVVTRLNDQHAFCRIDPDLRLDVGDLVACGISHPCTALDKWRVIPVVDGELRVVDAIATFF